MKKIKEMLPYLIVNVIAFYFIPIIIKDTGTAMVVMLILLPLICLLTSLIYGMKNSFNILYVILVALLFAPTIFIYYNSTASVYILGYGFVALVGNLVGKIFYKKNK